MVRYGRSLRAGKRWFDLALVVVAAVVWIPLAVLVALVVRLRLGHPVLYVQVRPGYGGELFTMYKFRTMTEAVNMGGEPLPDRDRMTRIGAFLRSTSLDELPELLNVLRGEMSLVGPRPLLVKYLDLYSPEQARRHDVRPGLTGWAQINGRNDVEWGERLARDVWYVDNASLRLDLEILIKTVAAVFSRRGINQTGEATVREFEGE